MTRRNTFLWLAAAAGYTGFGLLVGYMLSDHLKNAPLWLGIVLIFLFAILLGMYISARSDRQTLPVIEPAGDKTSSSGQIPLDPSKPIK